ncbi:MAG: serine/threonine protein kinase [Bdellovibrio sp.]|nr:serine/threonine protein kinase [Bdellovibrio sp.]
MRICPNCLKETDQEICPIDGFQTSEKKNFKLKIADPLIGQVFVNRYQIEKLIGEGGMGKVYLAKQISVGRDVAVKILLSDRPQAENDLIRFQREAMTVGQLQHPNTVKLYDYGETESGALFMAMEYIQGKTIRDYVKAGRKFTIDEVSAITKQILRSLREAHEHGIIHRDLKSSNIMLTEDFGEKDFVKVLDFGIAKNIFDKKEDSDLTGTGFVVGTPTYMSPEQILGFQLDGRSDLYSLGLIMYEMLTHRKPPKAKNRTELLNTRTDQGFLRFDDLPQTEKARSLYSLVSKSLEKMIDRRPKSAETFLTMIEKVDQSSEKNVILTPQEENKPPQQKKSLPIFPFLLVIALISIVSIKYLRHFTRGQNEAKSAIVHPQSDETQIVTNLKIATPIPTSPIPTPMMAPTQLASENTSTAQETYITVEAVINLDFAKNKQNLFLKIDGPLDYPVEIALTRPGGDHAEYSAQVELKAENLTGAKIPILFRSKRPSPFILSLIQSSSGESNVLARGMANMAILSDEKVVSINAATTLLANFVLKQNKSDFFSFRCIVNPYLFLTETLKQKYGQHPWSTPPNVLKEEITANTHIFSTAPPCQLMPNERNTKMIPITLSLEVDQLKLPAGSSIKLRILREDNFYFPLKAENSNSPPLELTPDLDFTISNDQKQFPLRFYTILPEDLDFGIVEITYNDTLVSSGLINLRSSEGRTNTQINSKTTLFNRSLNLKDYELPCLMQHLNEPASQIQETKVCIKRHPQKVNDPIRFSVTSDTLPKDTLLQREDLLFIPIKVYSEKREIEFANYLGPAWARLIIPGNSQASYQTILNLRDIMIRSNGVTVSPIGNFILTQIMGNDSLPQYDVECLFFIFYELMTLATVNFQISPQTTTEILEPDWKQHFRMLKTNINCKKQ